MSRKVEYLFLQPDKTKEEAFAPSLSKIVCLVKNTELLYYHFLCYRLIIYLHCTEIDTG